jgi:hypothetical protein
MTVVIAELFVPSSLLLTTASMRPVGGIVPGLYADRAGRKVALVTTR